MGNLLLFFYLVFQHKFKKLNLDTVCPAFHSNCRGLSYTHPFSYFALSQSYLVYSVYQSLYGFIFVLQRIVLSFKFRIFSSSFKTSIKLTVGIFKLFNPCSSELTFDKNLWVATITYFYKVLGFARQNGFLELS